MRRIVFLALISSLLLNVAAPLHGQPVPDPKAPPAESANDAATGPESPGRVVGARLETFYMKDKDGNLIAFFDIPFEDFEEIYKLYKGLETPDQKQKYVVHSIAIDGEARGEQADLVIQFSVTTKSDGWVRVPLRMNDMILRDTGLPSDTKDRFLEFQENGEGYVCWILGAVDKRFTFRLKAVKRLQLASDRYRLALNTVSGLGSTITLRVPHRDVEPLLSDQHILESKKSLPGDKTEIVASWSGSSLDIAWREVDAAAVKSRPTLHVDGDITVTFTGQTEIHSKAVLQVRATGGTVNSFAVQLPPAMQLVEDEDRKGYVVAEIKPDPKDDPALGQSVLVTMEKGIAESQTVIIAAQKKIKKGTVTAHEVAGFDVKGATYQAGFVNLAIDDEWSLKIEDTAAIRREDNIPADKREQRVVSRFAYDRQPYSLKAKIVLRRNLLSVEPQYLFFVDADQVRLEATLRCRLRGPSINTINLDFTGWVVDEIVERERVDLDNTIIDDVSPLAIHLSSLVPTSGKQFELTIRAFRLLTETEIQNQQLAIPIPQSPGTPFSAAAVIVSPASDVILTPTDAAANGLQSDSSPAPVVIPEGRRPAMYFRQQTEATAAAVATGFELRKRTTALVASALATVGTKQVEYRQEFLFRVEYQPLGFVSLDVPDALLTGADFQVYLGDEKLTSTRYPTATDAAQGWTRLRVELGKPRLGAFALVVSFKQDFAAPTRDQPRRVEQSLILPVADGVDELEFGRLEIKTADSNRCEPDPQDWKSASSNETTGLHSYVPNSGTMPGSLKLDIEFDTTRVERAIVIQSAWIQTWLSKHQRRERAVFRFTTRDGGVRIHFPDGSRVEDVLLNGVRVSGTRDTGSNELTLDVTGAGAQQGHVVECWYTMTGDRPEVGRCVLEFPRLVGAAWTRRCFWQLITPADEHLVFSPNTLTSEQQWQWAGLYWVRQANRNQNELADLLGATQQVDLPDATNQYLFSSFGGIDEVRFTTASRRNILLVVSLVTLAGGLLIIYVPGLRHPAALLALALLLLCFGLLYADLALQTAQIAALGIVFAVSVQLLKWTLERPRDSRPVIRGTSRSTYEGTTTEGLMAPGENGSRASSAVPLSVRVSPSTHSAGAHVQ